MYSRYPMKPQTLFTVLAVIFADNTALGDEATIEGVFRGRKASADELDLWTGKGLLNGSGEAKSLCSQMQVAGLRRQHPRKSSGSLQGILFARHAGPLRKRPRVTPPSAIGRICRTRIAPTLCGGV